MNKRLPTEEKARIVNLVSTEMASGVPLESALRPYKISKANFYTWRKSLKGSRVYGLNRANLRHTTTRAGFIGRGGNVIIITGPVSEVVTAFRGLSEAA